jgi:hypothetical protein
MGRGLDPGRDRPASGPGPVHGLGRRSALCRLDPEADKRAYREKCLARLEALYQAHADQALVKPRTAAVVRSIVMDQAKLLGIIQTQVKHEGQVNVDHAHVLDPGPTVEELLERWRAEGKLTVRGQLTRLDQGGG